MKKKLQVVVFAVLTMLFIQVQADVGINKIQIVALSNAPTNEAVVLQIIFPSNEDFVRKYPVNSQIRLETFSLGIQSRIYPQIADLRNDKDGQCVHVVIDDLPYFKVTLNSEDSANANFSLYRKMLTFDIPYKLEPGKHIMRAFPVLSYGESIKLSTSFDVHEFYYRKKDSSFTFDAKTPLLTYNEPQGNFAIKKDGPVLLDFYVSSAKLSPRDYKVLASVDNKVIMKITDWQPYLIYGLDAGEHMIELSLIDEADQVVKSPFNPIRRKISVSNAKK
ncbi:MAG: hypothetical protein HY860_04285 [Chlamydiales bacterium]|nr:hypothetical protein [Chlamydiales bacterium]